MKNTQDDAAETVSSTDWLGAFKRERDEALTSMDEHRIREFFRKWNDKELPDEPVVFWGSVHKAITGNTGLPMELRRKSKDWLASRGYRSFDDGDV